jgi:hypothetical protein
MVRRSGPRRQGGERGYQARQNQYTSCHVPSVIQKKPVPSA